MSHHALRIHTKEHWQAHLSFTLPLTLAVKMYIFGYAIFRVAAALLLGKRSPAETQGDPYLAMQDQVACQ